MDQYLYKTELDGMKCISSKKEIIANEYVYIRDEIYEDDITLFKNKNTVEDFLQLKLVKVADIVFLTTDEQQNYKWNQLYEMEHKVFTAHTRLSKSQIIKWNGGFFKVKEIIKKQGKPMELGLEELTFQAVTNLYPVYKVTKANGTKEVYKWCSSFGEALDLVMRLRSERGLKEYYSLS